MNEPYQRVSQDNGVFDGAFIGATIAAGGAGAGVFGASMHYNGIEKRHANRTKQLDNHQQYHENKLAKAQVDKETKTGNVGPRRWQANKYNNSVDYLDNINEGGRQVEAGLEQERQRRLQEARQQTAQETNRQAKKEARAETKKRYNFGYPKESAELKPEDVRHNENVNNVRNKHQERVGNINSMIDDAIHDTRMDTADIVKNSDEGKYVRKVNGQIDNRRNRIENRYNKKMDNHQQHLQNISDERTKMGSVDDMRSRHMYSKMGGWKNAAIIGASAVVGAGVGMLADGMNN